MSQLSYRAQWARHLVRDKVEDEVLQVQLASEGMKGWKWNEAFFSDDMNVDFSLKVPSTGTPIIKGEVKQQTPCRRPLKVCIVGAGVTGLYIALLLDSLDDPELSYDILEAAPYAGGRVRTHRFSTAAHDYCDTGAMRFPKIPFMERTFDLFHLLKVPLIPYHIEGPNCPMLFNDCLQIGKETRQLDAFRYGLRNGGLVPDELAAKGASRVLEEAFRPFKDVLAKDFEANFPLLLRQDRFSTKEFLRDKCKYDYHTIQWLETMCSATGLFDQSLTESVLDSLDFDYPQQPVEWCCIDGGGSLLVEKFLERIESKPQLGKQVTSIAIDRSETNDHNMFVHVRSEPAPRKYSTVFNTTSLACMQRMDLSAAELHPAQKEAIRSLHYDTSAKVAVKFSYPWWRVKCGVTAAGVASTDLPLRLCVYPSYNLSDGPDRPAVLLCSYTWAQDALRIGALVTDNSPHGEDELRDLIIRDLARLHADCISRDEIDQAYISHYAFDWAKDQNTSGAFALFGPGQFSNMYPYLSRPTADAKLHIVGEATSTHHAWLVGSFDSAYRAVHHFLQRFNRHTGLRRLEAQWGTPDEMETGESGTAHLQMMLGRLRPEDFTRLPTRDILSDGYVLVSRTETLGDVA